MAGTVQPLTARGLVALAASATLLALPGVAGAEGGQGAGVVQASQAAAVAVGLAPVNGARCFAGCPTVVVSTPAAVAVSFNIAAVVQLLTGSLGPIH